MERVIVHVDMDAFYASCEISKAPELQGKPVIIGGNPETKRGVVTTCSYPAREFNICSAMPITEAYKKCPHGVYLRPNYKLYKTISRNVMKILKQFSDVFQQAGIDEAYLDASHIINEYKSPHSYAKAIQNEIQQKENITCSVGIAPNKSVAKIGSDFRKPNGITIVPENKVLSFLRPLPVEKINGVGKKTKQILNQHGIIYIKDIQETTPDMLTSLLGKSGRWLWLVAQGKDDRAVGYTGSLQSMGKEHTFTKDTKNIQDIHKTFDWIASRLCQKLDSRSMEYKTVSIKVRLKGFETYTRSKTLLCYTQSKEIILTITKELFEEFRGHYVRLVGIRLTNLRKGNTHQKSLTAWL
ncbi:MAG: DNA polymerase IV [Candidatus Methanofastidiosia archaeon]|jgi:DNA polymerase IV (DinB-like DNA polymerase)